MLIRLATALRVRTKKLSVATSVAAAALSNRQHDDDSYPESSRKPAKPAAHCAIRASLWQIPWPIDVPADIVVANVQSRQIGAG
jgi:hypothetical protein